MINIKDNFSQGSTGQAFSAVRTNLVNANLFHFDQVSVMQCIFNDTLRKWRGIQKE